MKKIILLGLVAIFVLGIAAYVYAATAIKNGGEHDIPAQLGLNRTDDRMEPCKYCHTPHNAYSSGVTTAQVPLNNRQAANMTEFCQDCHEDANNGVGLAADMQDTFAAEESTTLGAASYAIISGVMDLGGVDHPVGGSVSYSTTTANGITLRSEANAETDLNNAASPYYALDSVDLNGRIDCNSCHYVHVYTEAPTNAVAYRESFLRISNSGSQMCLACHDI